MMDRPNHFMPGYRAASASHSQAPNEALMSAAIAGDKARIDAAIARGAGLNAPADIQYQSSMYFHEGILVKGTTPFQSLISNGHHALAQHYLDKDGDIRALTKDGFDAFHLTCHNWHPETIKWLAFKQGFSSNLKTPSLYQSYNCIDGGAPSESEMINRRNFMTNMTIANDLKDSDVGLAEALDLQESAPNLELTENDILEIVKTLVEYCDHTQIKDEITCRGFGRKGSFTGMSCYKLAESRNLNALVKYFDTLDSLNSAEKIKP